MTRHGVSSGHSSLSFTYLISIMFKFECLHVRGLSFTLPQSCIPPPLAHASAYAKVRKAATATGEREARALAALERGSAEHGAAVEQRLRALQDREEAVVARERQLEELKVGGNGGWGVRATGWGVMGNGGGRGW